MAERLADIRLLPARQPSLGTLHRACKRPRCSNEIEPPEGRSRPREFCSNACRTLYQRERDQARAHLLEAHRIAAQYEVDDTAADTAAAAHDRPPQASADAGDMPPATASYLALALVAQTLESLKVEIQDGLQVGIDEALDRLTRAKEQGDRLMGANGRNPPTA
jgi:hypothetical protein